MVKIRILLVVMCFAVLNVGSAQFGPPQSIQVGFEEHPKGGELVDLDYDGDLDVIVRVDGKLVWYENEGDRFGLQNIFDQFPNIIKGFKLGDLDQDGAIDIVARLPGSSGLGWIRNLGNGEFGDLIFFQYYEDAGAFLLEDMDLDGDPDIYVFDPEWDGVYWIENYGAGNFGSSILQFDDLININSMAADDLNGDGFPDLVVGSNGPVAWYENNGSGEVLAQNAVSSIFYDSFQVIPNDVDDDGDVDLVVSYPDDEAIVAFSNDGMGGFTMTDIIVDSISSYNTDLQDIDFDGDADLLATSTTGFTYIHANTAGAFAPPIVVQSSGWSRSVDTGDIDLDGDLDVLTCIGSPVHSVFWTKNDGSNTFGADVPISSATDGPWSLVVDDLDSDGSIDLLITSSESDWTSTHLNKGNGSFQIMNRISSLAGATHSRYDDMDQDGDKDIVVGGDTYLNLLRNDGFGIFGTPEPMFLRSRLLEVGDLNGDGAPDIVAIGGSQEVLSWYQNDGNGIMNFVEEWWGSSNLADIDLSDIDGDGDIDILRVDEGGGVGVRENDGSGNFTHIVLGDYGDIDMGSIDPVDLDGDGDMDLIVADNYHGEVYSIENAGGLDFYAEQLLYGSMTGVTDVISEDLDGDGDQDIIVGSDIGVVHWFENDGNGVLNGPNLITDSSGDIQRLRTADLDGDGDKDIVALVTADDKVIWFENFIGSPFSIEGAIFWDQNGNGALDPNEPPLPYSSIYTTPISSVPLTDTLGQYHFAVDSGSYTVGSLFNEQFWQLSTDSATYSVQLGSNDPNISNLDFGYSTTVDTTLFNIEIVAGTGPCDDQMMQFVSIQNIGTSIPSGTVCFELDPAFQYVSASIAPVSVNGNTICWQFNNLAPFDFFSVDMEVINPPVSAIFDPVGSNVIINEQDSLGNTIATYQEFWASTVQCSYDPNDKQVEPEGYGQFHAIDISTEFLEYTIRFQNTGNAPAQNVVLRDKLPSEISPESIHVLGFSHTPTNIIVENENELVFEFIGIGLVDSASNPLESMGYVRFKADVENGLPHQTSIENEAEIYFDLNPPIITNTVQSTLVDCNLWDPSIAMLTETALIAELGLSYQWYRNGVAIPDDTTRIHLLTNTGHYSVEVTSIYGCVAISDTLSIISVGLEELNKIEIGVHPNPFTDWTIVQFSQELTPKHYIEVIDLRGRVVSTHTLLGGTTFKLNREGLRSGLYLVRLANENSQVGVARLVVQ